MLAAPTWTSALRPASSFTAEMPDEDSPLSRYENPLVPIGFQQGNRLHRLQRPTPPHRHGRAPVPSRCERTRSRNRYMSILSAGLLLGPGTHESSSG